MSLYPDPLQHASNFRSAPPHAGAFYQKLGFVVCGVLPDANGNGKPDILFALRV
jgi:aminoglycoside 6'-N-acetyltransferase I